MGVIKNLPNHQAVFTDHCEDLAAEDHRRSANITSTGGKKTP